MRARITHPGAGELHYEIRSIVEFANKLQATGLEIVWENIGDPIAKGEKVPLWIKQLIAKESLNDLSLAYSPTKGLLEARRYLAEVRSKQTKGDITAENIIFFNGLGDAIHEIYTWLSPFARVLGPSPAYPTHSSNEGAHARSRHRTYNLDPDNNWLPDMKDVRDKVHFDPDIVGLLIINPDNPTGMIYPPEVLKDLVGIAKEYGLFLIADEIYANLAFNQEEFISLAELADGVPTMIMRGLSKEVPWPGSRCGWVEFYNTGKDQDFAKYVKSVEEAKMNEVCSTTLPQAVLPKILSDGRYDKHLEKRRQKYASRAKLANDMFESNKYLNVIEPGGAFYLSVTLSDEFFCNPPRISINNPVVRQLLDGEIDKETDMPIDKKFCLELLASTGICTVPLSSGFNSHVQGFRMTLLEEDIKKFIGTINQILDLF